MDTKAIKFFDAVIESDEKWSWQPADHHPEILIGDAHPPSKQRPKFLRGHLLRIRLEGCAEDCVGPHTIKFRNVAAPIGMTSPLEEPNNGSVVTYDEPSKALFKISAAATENSLWTFNIKCAKRDKNVDPEFHVGTGN